MVALLLLAALPAGRWGGLDFFLHHGCGRPAPVGNALRGVPEIVGGQERRGGRSLQR